MSRKKIAVQRQESMRKKKYSETARRVTALKSFRGETQAQFAKTLGVTQPMISAWEGGSDAPSPAFCLRLGSLAPYPDNIWFWQQAGMNKRVILSVAQELLQEGNAPPLPGEIIRIPRVRETTHGREESGPPIPLPIEFIPNPASTICFLVDKEATAIVDSPKAVFILDEAGKNAPNLLPFWGQVIFVEYDPEKGTETRYERGIYAGRLVAVHFWPEPGRRAQYHASARLFLLTDPMAERSAWIGFWADRSLRGLEDLSTSDSTPAQNPVVIGARKEARERALRELKLDLGWRILGRMLGRLKLEGVENG